MNKNNDNLDPLPVDFNGPDVMGVVILMSVYAVIWFFIGIVSGWIVWA